MRRPCSLIAAIAIAITVAWPAPARSAVWEARESWSEAWEDRFAAWVRDTVTPETVLDPARPYYEQKLDCADLIYFLRAVFSYENRLDFAATGGDGLLLTHETRAFDSISDEGTRVKEFLRRLLLATNTTTLARDSVLVPIDRRSIRSGAFLATDSAINHVWLVRDISPSGIPDLLSATEPASEMIYPAYSFPTGASAFSRSGAFLSGARGGFRRYLRPQEIRLRARAANAPDQLAVPIATFFETVRDRLAEAAETDEQRHERRLDELCLQMRIRTNLVTEAVLATRSGRPASRAELDSLSTPARDSRIRSLIQELRAEHRRLARGRAPSPALAPVLEKSRLYLFDSVPAPAYSEAELRNVCLVQWAENRVEPLAPLVQRFDLASPDARASLEERWGEPAALFRYWPD